MQRATESAQAGRGILETQTYVMSWGKDTGKGYFFPEDVGCLGRWSVLTCAVQEDEEQATWGPGHGADSQDSAGQTHCIPLIHSQAHGRERESNPLCKYFFFYCPSCACVQRPCLVSLRERTDGWGLAEVPPRDQRDTSWRLQCLLSRDQDPGVHLPAENPTGS